tara:strand:+ start:12059 stop:12232 length:174 start_codon:yes stop_codon:yes gene_type:complete
MNEFDKSLKKILDKNNVNIDWNESIESIKSKNDSIKKRLDDLPDTDVESILKIMLKK